MSKRQIEVQGTKDGTSFLGDGSASANTDDVPKRATAAQLANRKLKPIKPGARKHTAALHSTPQSTLNQASGAFGQRPQGTPSFPFGAQQPAAPQQSNPFGFAQPQPPQQQQQSGGMFGNTTNSFPPAQSATPGSSFVNQSFPAFGAGGNASAGFGGFNPTPPTAPAFSFFAGGPNPFASANPTPALNGNTPGGFSGSIFSLPATQPTAPPAAENGQPPPSTQPLGSAFSFGGTSTPNAPTSNVFGATSTSSAPPSNIFGADSTSSAPTSNIFGQTTGSTSNVFGAVNQGSTPTSNVFQTNGLATAAFGASPEKKPFSPDAMQTSPDYSPSKSSDPPATLPHPAGGSLFERISAADPKTQDAPTPTVETPQSQPTPSVFGQTPATEDSGKAQNPFARLKRTPSPAKEAAPAPPAEASKPVGNPFAGLSTPFSAASQASSCSSPQAASTPFSVFSKPSEPIPSPSKQPQSSAPVFNPFANSSKPSESAPSPSKQPQPSTAASSQAPTFAPALIGAPTLGASPSAFAPPKGSPLKFATNASALSTPEKPTTPSTSTSNNPGSSQGTTDAIKYDSTGKIIDVDLVNATIADMEKALGLSPPLDADDLGGEVWVNREKLRVLNIGYRDRINGAGVYADWTELTRWYLKTGDIIVARLKAAKSAKIAQGDANSGPMNAPSKRKADSETEVQHEVFGSVAKKSKSGEQSFVPQKPLSQTAKSLEDVLNGSPVAPSPPPPSDPPTNIFSAGDPPEHPNPLFSATAPFGGGSLRPADTPAKNFSSSVSATTTSNNIFGDSKKPASNIFGSLSKTPASNPLGFASKEPASNIFGSSKQSTSNVFSPKPKDPSVDLGLTAEKQPAPSFFASASKAPTSNIFGSNNSSTSPFQKAATSVTDTPTPAFNPVFKPSTSLSTDNATACATPTFTVKPPPAAATPNGFQLPKFSLGSGTPNFMQQFASKSKTAEEMVAEAKQKAMDAELPEPDDSDYEEEKAEFEAKWEEEQRQKREKLAAEAKKAPSFQFTPTASNAGSNVSSDNEGPAKPAFTFARPTSAASSPGLFGTRNSSPAPSTSGSTSVFDAPAVQSAPVNNIFGHLSEAESGADAGNDGDDDEEGETEESDDQEAAEAAPVRNFRKRMEADEESEDDTIEEVMRRKRPDRTPQGEKDIEKTQTPPPSKGRSLFDRISYGPDGKPERALPTSEGEKTNGVSEAPKKAALFGNTLPPSSPFQPSGSPSGDNTFKHNSPIKFASTAPPAFSYTAPSPANGTPNLFGSLTAKSFLPKASASSTGTSTPTFSFGAPVSSAPVGSLLSASGATSAFPSGVNSPFMSRGATPFSADEASGKETSGADTKGKSNEEEDKLSDAQVKLTDLTEAEKEDHDILFEFEKSKVMVHDKESKSNEGNWTTKGVGPVRILKHKKTGAVSLLMRASPGGNIVVNARLMPIAAVVTGKTVKVSLAMGPKLSIWLFRFASEETAADFTKTYNENKP